MSYWLKTELHPVLHIKLAAFIAERDWTPHFTPEELSHLLTARMLYELGVLESPKIAYAAAGCSEMQWAMLNEWVSDGIFSDAVEPDLTTRSAMWGF